MLALVHADMARRVLLIPTSYWSHILNAFSHTTSCRIRTQRPNLGTFLPGLRQT